jgi:hypothetical protein
VEKIENLKNKNLIIENIMNLKEPCHNYLSKY